MPERERRRSPKAGKKTYKRPGEPNELDRSQGHRKTRPETKKKRLWPTQKRQLQHMDIEDLRQYVFESDEC